jgi:hypothetical protein
MARERVEERFAVDVVDRNCHVTVVTYITECRATATASLGKAAFGTGNELEPAIAKVPKELVIADCMTSPLACLWNGRESRPIQSDGIRQEKSGFG